MQQIFTDVFLSRIIGSTNPKDGEPAIKNEIDHWSDPEFQISKAKYSPAAKTLMDRAALEFGESHPDLRIVIFNPSMILGGFSNFSLSNSIQIPKSLQSRT